LRGGLAWLDFASESVVQTSTKASFLEPEQQLVTLDDERVRVEARVTDRSPFMLISSLGIYMGFHVAETRRNVQVGSHLCRECRRVLFCSS